MGKESFILYDNYATQINLLNDEQAGVLFKAIFAHRTGEALPKMDGATAMAFSFISSSMQADEERYEKICEKRKQAGLKNAERIANDSKCYQMIANDSKSTPDIDIDIDIDKSQKKEETKKKKENAKQELSLLTEAQRQAKQRDLEKQRLEITREIEKLLVDISKLKKGKSLRMKNPRKLGRRPNDTVDD